MWLRDHVQRKNDYFINFNHDIQYVHHVIQLFIVIHHCYTLEMLFKRSGLNGILHSAISIDLVKNAKCKHICEMAILHVLDLNISYYNKYMLLQR